VDLSIKGFSTGYGRARICRDVSLEVSSGEIVTLLGANGAGKSTLMRGIAGLTRPFGGRVVLDGASINRWSPQRRIHAGLIRVPQEPSAFPEMTVHENLLMGAYLVRSRSMIAERLEQVLEIFPLLSERQSQLAGTMSGGQQRLLVIGRALMVAPRVLLLDEPCTGLSPHLQTEVRTHLRRLAGTGVSVLVAEQNIPWAVAASQRVVVFARGTVRSEHRTVADAGNAPISIEQLLSEIGAAAQDTVVGPSAPGGAVATRGGT
jgi:branched-chain amino acid transport system ATP-binding protein